MFWQHHGQAQDTVEEVEKSLEKAKQALIDEDLSQAESIAEQIIEMAGPDLPNSLKWESQKILAEVSLANNDFFSALYNFSEIALEAQEDGDQQKYADANMGIGLVYSGLPAYLKAIDHYEIAYETSKGIPDVEGIAKALRAKAGSYLSVGKIGEASIALGQLDRFALENNLVSYEIFAVQGFIGIHNTQGDVETAIQFSKRLFDLNETEKNALSLSNLYLEVEDYNAARKYVKFLLDKDPLKVEHLIASGKVKLGENRVSDAMADFDQAFEVARSTNDNLNMVYSLNGKAQTLSADGNTKESLRVLSEAEMLGESKGLSEGLVETYRIFTQVYAKRKKQDLARDYKVKFDELVNSIQEQGNIDPSFYATAEALADDLEQQVTIQLADVQKKKLEEEQSTLKEVQQQTEITLAERERMLQEQQLQRKSLEAAKATQDLRIAQQELEAQRRQSELAQLQREAQFRELTEEENQRKLELAEQQRVVLEQKSALQQQEIQAADQRRSLYITIIVISILALVLLVIFFVRTARSKQIISRQNLDLSKQQRILKNAQHKLKKTLSNEYKVRKALEKTYNDLKSTQARLVHAEKMSSLGQLTAGIAHEINNPVSFIRGGVHSFETAILELVEIVEDYEEAANSEDNELRANIDQCKEESHEILQDIREMVEQLMKDIIFGTERVSEIVNGLRTFSRHDEAMVKPANIHENIDSALLILKTKYKDKAEITKEYDESIGVIECLPGQLNQVFVNLISNALDALPDKGMITISTFDEGEEVKLVFKDNGKGIPEEVRSKIFEPFFTTKEIGKGTGLGLSISYSIIEQHKGSIEVESEVGKGTEFIIRLPKILDMTDEQIIEEQLIES